MKNKCQTNQESTHYLFVVIVILFTHGNGNVSAGEMKHFRKLKFVSFGHARVFRKCLKARILSGYFGTLPKFWLLEVRLVRGSAKLQFECF